MTAALALGGCRDALDGDACLAACERRITCSVMAEADRYSCERACNAGGACDPGAADACAYCLVEARCDELEEECAEACADPCDVGSGGSGGDDGSG